MYAYTPRDPYAPLNAINGRVTFNFLNMYYHRMQTYEYVNMFRQYNIIFAYLNML